MLKIELWAKLGEQFSKKFGANLKRIGSKLGLAQEEIAISFELSANQISKIELGEICKSLSTVSEVAKTLNIDVEELFDF